MKRSVYFYNCLREIRQTVYGRDMRKPIADSIEEIGEFDLDRIIRPIETMIEEKTPELESVHAGIQERYDILDGRLVEAQRRHNERVRDIHVEELSSSESNYVSALNETDGMLHISDFKVDWIHGDCIVYGADSFTEYTGSEDYTWHVPVSGSDYKLVVQAAE